MANAFNILLHLTAELLLRDLTMKLEAYMMMTSWTQKREGDSLAKIAMGVAIAHSAVNLQLGRPRKRATPQIDSKLKPSSLSF